MTDKTQALSNLLEKVEAGADETDYWWNDNVFGDLREPLYIYGQPAFYGSLNAAKALHDAVRPGQPFNVHFEQHMDGHYCALFGAIPDDAEKWNFAPKWEAKTPLQSRSLLACELRAMIAQATP